MLPTGPLCGDPALDALGHQLQRVGHLLLEIAVGRAARHRADRAHAAVIFVAAALVEEHLARALVGAGEQRAEHRAIGAGGDRLGEVAGKLDAAIGDHRHAVLAAFLDGIDDRGELRHADPGDHAGRADRARPDADLDRVGAGLDQRPRALGGRDVADDDLGVVRHPADLVDRFEHPRRMAVRGVDDHDVDPGGEQRLGPLELLAAGAGGGGDAQPAVLVLAGVRKALRLLDVLDGDQAGAAIVVVDDQQLFDAVLVQQALGLLARDVLAHRDQLVLGHQLGDRLARIAGEAHVAVGQDADEPAG